MSRVSRVELEDLREGERYAITIDDCCVQGNLVGIFLGWDSIPADDPGDSLVYHRAKFDFGSIEGWGWFTHTVPELGEGKNGDTTE